MKANIANVLCLAAQRLGIQGVEHRPNYSGRGMFGKTTDAILIPKESDLLKILMQAAIDTSTSENLADDEEISDDVDQELLTEVEKFRTDNLSDNIIVY